MINKKTCPYDEECVFLHEDSKLCRYGENCERTYCMFKHDDNTENKKVKSELNENVGDVRVENVDCDKVVVDNPNIIKMSNV